MKTALYLILKKKKQVWRDGSAIGGWAHNQKIWKKKQQ